jgi:hypothetical protein
LTCSAEREFFGLASPSALVRLLQNKKTSYDSLRLRASRPDGQCWLEEELLVRINCARLGLAIRRLGTPLSNAKAPGFRKIELLGKPGPIIG